MDMKYCSLEVKNGVKWLENDLKKMLLDYQDTRRLALSDYAYSLYVLYKINYPSAVNFIKTIENKKFWSRHFLYHEDTLLPYSDALYYLAKMGFNKNEHFKKIVQEYIKEKQMTTGYIRSFEYDHTAPMRVLVLIEPESEYTKRAIEFFIKKYTNFLEKPDILSWGILALYDYNFYKYFNIIKNLSSVLKKKFLDEICGKIETHFAPPYTSSVIQALSYVFGSNDESIRKYVVWLKKNLNSDGSWFEEALGTSEAILSLIYAGEGPKISKDKWEQKELLYQQKLKMTKSNIVVTSPFSGEFEIKNKIKEMINNTNNRLWICSRFITEFWTDLISLKKDKPEIDMKIITIPKKEAKEKYIGHGKKFVEPAFDTLQRFLENNFRTTPLLHARYIIADDTVLVSSADLTSEQLEKEFNLGIWTRDPETVQESVGVFENLWKSIVNEKD